MMAVKQTLDERCNENIESIYKLAIKLIIETISDGYGEDQEGASADSSATQPGQRPPGPGDPGSGSRSSGGGGGGGGAKCPARPNDGPANANNNNNNNNNQSHEQGQRNGQGHTTATTKRNEKGECQHTLNESPH